MSERFSKPAVDDGVKDLRRSGNRWMTLIVFLGIFAFFFAILSAALYSANRSLSGRLLVDFNGRLAKLEKDIDTLEAELRKHRDLTIASIRSIGGKLDITDSGEVVMVDLSTARVSLETDMVARALTLPGLKTLQIGSTGLTPELLRDIAAHPTIETLFFRESLLDDDMLAYLADNMPNLRRLTLRRVAHVSDTGVGALARAPNLRALSCLGLSITVETLDRLAEAPTLTSLDLRMCGGIATADYAALAGIKRLSEVKLGGFPIDDSVLEVLAKLPRLTHLLIEDAQITPEGLERFLKTDRIADRLRSFGLSRTFAIDDQALAALGNCKALVIVALKEMPTTGAFLDSLVREDGTPFPLETLSLDQTFLMDDAFPRIARFKTLRRVDLFNVLVNAEALEQLATLPELRRLNLAGTHQTDESLKVLRRFPALESLNLSGNAFLTSAAWETLDAVATLKQVDFEGTALAR